MKKDRFEKRFLPGSAFIMVFVLTSLLALIGLIFLLTSRVDKLSTSAIEENKQLDAAIDTVIAQISQQLVRDTPGIDPNEGSFEYYDYPDQYNRWLASLEPYEDGSGNYCWRQISDVTGFLYLNTSAWGYTLPENPIWNVPVNTPEITYIIPDYPEIEVTDGLLEENWADADGDGIADSKWIPLASFDETVLNFVPDMTTNKGEPVYAAIRIIDNSAMLNVNTAYKFDLIDPALERDDIDGSSQLHVNLAELSQRGSNGTLSQAANELHSWRCNYDPNLTLSKYEGNVIWNYVNAVSGYTPFDVSSEIELRNRYLINLPGIDAPIENIWTNAFKSPNLRTPVQWSEEEDERKADVNDWFYRSQHEILGPSDIYSYRHIATTNNLDRIIDPYGDRMANVNKLDDVNDLEDLYVSVSRALLDANVVDTALAAQLAVNMKDFTDDDSEVSVYASYSGFEKPCIFISELVHAYRYIDPNGADFDPCTSDYNDIYHSYAIEIYKRFPSQNNDGWTLNIPRYGTVGLSNNYGSDSKRYYVLVFEDPCVPIQDLVVFSDSPANGETDVDPNVTLAWECPWFNPRCLNSDYSYDVYFGLDCKSAGDCDSTCENLEDANRTSAEFLWNQHGTSFKPSNYFVIEPNVTYCWRIDDIKGYIPDVCDGDVVQKGEVWHYTVGDPKPVVIDINHGDIIFKKGDILQLARDIGSKALAVDFVPVPPVLFDYNSISGIELASYQREMSSGKFIKRLWVGSVGQSLGHYNGVASYFYYDPDPDKCGPIPSKAVPVFFGRLNNIGELGKVFSADIYSIDFNSVNLEELNVRVDVNNPVYQKLFKYLTVFDPNNYGRDLTETRIKGRININTAPWYVINQLPWLSKLVEYVDLTTNKVQDVNDLAKAVTNYRDYTFGPFDSIGQLNHIQGFYIYGLDGDDQMWYPDLTVNSRTRKDGVTDDFEERDLIFARISDLVTVRSDLFTAYILVRLGRTGPQKRVIAILDRSEVTPTGGEVKVRALYEVPDAR